jgi:hypothetical protein
MSRTWNQDLRMEESSITSCPHSDMDACQHRHVGLCSYRFDFSHLHAFKSKRVTIQHRGHREDTARDWR